MEQNGSEKVIFWELDPSVEQPLPAPNSVEPCIRTSGVTDIGIFTDEQDIRTPVDKMNFQPGGKYHCSYTSQVHYVGAPPLEHVD